MFDTLRQVEGSISPGVLFSVLRNASISLIYGVSVYIISLVVRIVLKPRIG
jgi:inner membrane protein involved in colicin E2 resistance